MSEKKKVAVIGGGNGSAVVIAALKQNPERFDIDAVITMSDSGGSSGRLRAEIGVLPPGDILRTVLALSRHEYTFLRDIFYCPRFSGVGKLDGHNIGNIFLTFAGRYGGDFISAVRALEQALGAVGRAHPATLTPCDLCGELTNGQVIKTEGALDVPAYDRAQKIKRVWLEPEVNANPEAVRAVKDADYIVLCPGSLYTSLIAALLPRGVKEAVAASEAKLVYVSGNAYRRDHETGPERLSDFVKQLEGYLPRPLDLVIYNNHKLNRRQADKYAENKWAVFPADTENMSKGRVAMGDYERAEGGLCAIKLGRILKKILI